MPDYIKPLKLENPSLGGTQTDYLPTESNPAQDYLAAKGLAIEGLGTFLIDKSGNDMQFKDVTTGVTSTLYQLLSGSSGLNLGRYVILLSHNATVSSGTWLGYNELIPGDTTPIVLPRNCELRDVTWSNSNVDNQGTLTFRLGTTGATPFRTWTIATGASGKIQTLTGISDNISAGSMLFIQWTKTGGNSPSDLGLTLHLHNV